MDYLNENILLVRDRLEKAATRAGRSAKDISLLLATKTVEPERILEALRLGEVLIGENRVQELVEKFEALKDTPHKTHLIGPLQSNKINKIIGRVSCVESIDNIKTATALNTRLLGSESSLDILIEVNTSGEGTKHGVAPEEVFRLIEEVSELKALRIKGLMTIGTLTSDEAEIRRCFRLLKSLSVQIANRHYENVSMDVVSMGMSDDFEIAIEEGSTEIRVGSGIFGKRPRNDAY